MTTWRRTWRRGTPLAAIVVVAAALTSGCGIGPWAPSPDEVVRGSYQKLVEAKTAHMVLSGDMAAEGQSIRLNGSGDLDLAQSSSTFTVELPGTGDLRGIQQGPVAYVSLPPGAAPPGVRPWLRIDPEALRKAGPAGQQLAQGAGENPFGQLALVQGATPDTRELGPGTVAGEQVTRYGTTIDFARARQSTTDPVILSAIDEYTKKVGGSGMPGEVWVDSDGRLRKLNLTLPASASGPTGTVGLEFSALGAPVAPVTPPPADQVTDAAELIARAGR